MVFHSDSGDRTSTPDPVDRQGKPAVRQAKKQDCQCLGCGRLFKSRFALGGHRSGNIQCTSADSTSTPAPTEPMSADPISTPAPIDMHGVATVPFIGGKEVREGPTL